MTNLASVGSESEGVRVGLPVQQPYISLPARTCTKHYRKDLPNIQLSTAGSVATDTSRIIAVRGDPTLNVTLTTNPLEVAGALGVTVTSTVLGTSGVATIALATIGIHGDKVEGAVHAAGDGGQVHVEGELVARKIEHLVCRGVLHEIETGANVGSILVLGDKVERQGIAAGGSTVGTLVVGTFNSAVLGAVGVAGALVGPLITIVAVLRSADYSSY